MALDIFKIVQYARTPPGEVHYCKSSDTGKSEVPHPAWPIGDSAQQIRELDAEVSKAFHFLRSTH